MNCEYSGNVPLFNEFSSLNSILMATLYSENSRNLIIKNAKNWDSSNKYKTLIKKIVNKNKRKNDISKEISLLNPETGTLAYCACKCNVLINSTRLNKSAFMHRIVCRV